MIADEEFSREPVDRIGQVRGLKVRPRSDRAPVPAAARLSRREHEVLSWVSRGKTNPQIAAILSVSARTVQKHLEHIYDKLGVRTRAAAAVALAGGASVPGSGLGANLDDQAP